MDFSTQINNRITVDWERVPPIEVDPMKIPDQVKMKAGIPANRVGRRLSVPESSLILILTGGGTNSVSTTALIWSVSSPHEAAHVGTVGRLSCLEQSRYRESDIS